jgi:hypothetical protein
LTRSSFGAESVRMGGRPDYEAACVRGLRQWRVRMGGRPDYEAACVRGLMQWRQRLGAMNPSTAA